MSETKTELLATTARVPAVDSRQARQSAIQQELPALEPDGDEHVADQKRDHRARAVSGLTARPPPGETLCEDLLEGADAIAEFLFGDADKRRKVYHLVSDKKDEKPGSKHSKPPVFRLGTTICARKSILLKWIAAQEDRHGHEAA